MVAKLLDYKWEMVTVFLPLRCEHIESVTHELLQLFNKYHEAIMKKFAEYKKINIEEYNTLCEDLQEKHDEVDARQEHVEQTMATTNTINNHSNSIDIGNLTADVYELMHL